MARDLKELLHRGDKYDSYSPSDYGVWEVHGEDANCDLGGAHSNPLLGYYEGTFEDVCKHALTLKGFFQWGAGGYVTKANETIKSATLIGEGSKKVKRDKSIKNLLHDAKEFAKEKLGHEYNDEDIVDIKFCDLVKMLKDYEKDGK